jgi:hypothetical protein
VNAAEDAGIGDLRDCVRETSAGQTDFNCLAIYTSAGKRYRWGTNSSAAEASLAPLYAPLLRGQMHFLLFLRGLQDM